MTEPRPPRARPSRELTDITQRIRAVGHSDTELRDALGDVRAGEVRRRPGDRFEWVANTGVDHSMMSALRALDREGALTPADEPALTALGAALLLTLEQPGEQP